MGHSAQLDLSGPSQRMDVAGPLGDPCQRGKKSSASCTIKMLKYLDMKDEDQQLAQDLKFKTCFYWSGNVKLNSKTVCGDFGWLCVTVLTVGGLGVCLFTALDLLSLIA